MSDDLSGFSMFELFKEEAQAHSAVLSDGLLALESNPDQLSHVEQLMRAAHSIKGAARIINIDPVVELAHAMEDCFVAVQKGKERLTSERVDQLLQGVDVMQQLAELSEGDVPSWIETNGAAAVQLGETIRQPVTPAAPAKGPAPETLRDESGDLSGFSMFELFKEEAHSHAAVLSDGLLALEASPDDLSQVEQLMRAAHSIKGAARIINIDPVVELAHAMEDCFVAVQKGKESLTSERVDQLLQGVDIMQQLAELSEDELASWLKSNGPAAVQLGEAIRQPVAAADSVKTPATDTSQSDESEVGQPVERDEAEPESAEPDTAEPKSARVPLPEQPPTSQPEKSPQPPTESTNRESAAPPDVPRKAEPVAEDRIVPVDSENLNRIMRLASESMIESRRLQGMSRSLVAMRQLALKAEEILQQAGQQGSVDAQKLTELRELNQHSKQLLQEHSTQLEQALWRSEKTSTALYYEVIGSRMRPFIEGTRAFPRMIRDLSRSLGKKVSFEVRGGDVDVDRDILRKLEAPLNHILRNCVDHGIESPDERRAAGKSESGAVALEARHHAGMLTIRASDDGRGVDLEKLRRKIVAQHLTDESIATTLNDDEILEFLFLPGFSTAEQITEVSGRGVGLDVVRNMVQQVSGTVRIDSEPGRSTTFTLRLPVTLSVIRAALAEIAGEPYAFPLSRLERIIRIPRAELQPVQGRQQFMLDGQSVGLIDAVEILELNSTPAERDSLSVIVIGQDRQLCGLAVDGFIGEQDLVVRPLDRRLGRVPHISAAAVMESGDPLLIVDVEDLFQSLQQRLGEGRLRGMTSFDLPRGVSRRPRILVVDDSITVREVERQLLVAQGYDVDVAVDGQDGWHKLRARSYDLLVTDVDMPRMNGVELIRHARQEERFADLPIIIVSYKDRDEDRLLGLQVGANSYLTKGSFHDDSFVNTVADLIGEPTDADRHR